MERFLAELKRRNVLRVAAFYAATGGLLIQIATQVLPLFDVPAWTLRTIVVAVALGFPFLLVFAWLYEITPEGLKRENEVDPSQSIARITGRKLDRMIIGWSASSSDLVPKQPDPNQAVRLMRAPKSRNQDNEIP